MKTEIKRLADIEPRRLKKMVSNSVEKGIIKITEKTVLRLNDESPYNEMILYTFWKDLNEYYYLTPEEVYFFRYIMDNDYMDEVIEDNKILSRMWHEELIQLYKDIAPYRGFRKVKSFVLKSQVYDTEDLLFDGVITL